MDTTKAALKETADKERALNAKLAKVSERGREGQRGRRETGGQGGREKGREGVMCRCGVLRVYLSLSLFSLSLFSLSLSPIS